MLTVGRSVVNVKYNISGFYFTARCYASAVLAMGPCLSICVAASRSSTKRLNVGSHRQNRTIAQVL